MKTFKARGIVLREYEAGESDKRLVLLCKEYGRLTVYARGVRKPKSKLMAAAQVFTYGDYILGDGRQFLTLTQADLIESFYGLRRDYDRLCRAHYAAEICERTVMDSVPCDDLLMLLLKTLSYLNQPDDTRFPIPPEQAASVFLMRFFASYGLTPETNDCCVCGQTPEGGGVFFCEEGLLCPACAPRKPHKMPISPAAVAALTYLLEQDLSRAFLFKASEAVRQELTRAGRLLWDHHFQFKLRSEALW